MLTSIHIYPFKGGRGLDLPESAVEPWGLAGDRRWLLVDEDFRFVSQREQPSLARLVVRYGPDGSLLVSSEGHPPLAVAVPAAGELLKVSVWSSMVLAAAAGPKAGAWFSAYLGQPVRFVYLDDPTRRPGAPDSLP